MKKIVPLITCEIPFSQHVCDLEFGVNETDLNLRVQIDPVKQPIIRKCSRRNALHLQSVTDLWTAPNRVKLESRPSAARIRVDRGRHRTAERRKLHIILSTCHRLLNSCHATFEERPFRVSDTTQATARSVESFSTMRKPSNGLPHLIWIACGGIELVTQCGLHGVPQCLKVLWRWPPSRSLDEWCSSKGVL